MKPSSSSWAEVISGVSSADRLCGVELFQMGDQLALSKQFTICNCRRRCMVQTILGSLQKIVPHSTSFLVHAAHWYEQEVFGCSSSIHDYFNFCKVGCVYVIDNFSKIYSQIVSSTDQAVEKRNHKTVAARAEARGPKWACMCGMYLVRICRELIAQSKGRLGNETKGSSPATEVTRIPESVKTPLNAHDWDDAHYDAIFNAVTFNEVHQEMFQMMKSAEPQIEKEHLSARRTKADISCEQSLELCRVQEQYGIPQEFKKKFIAFSTAMSKAVAKALPRMGKK